MSSSNIPGSTRPAPVQEGYAPPEQASNRDRMMTQMRKLPRRVDHNGWALPESAPSDVIETVTPPARCRRWPAPSAPPPKRSEPTCRPCSTAPASAPQSCRSARAIRPNYRQSSLSTCRHQRPRRCGPIRPRERLAPARPDGRPGPFSKGCKPRRQSMPTSRHLPVALTTARSSQRRSP